MQLHDVCRVLQDLAPPKLAQAWDRVGLLVGDEQADCGAVMLTVDLTHAVLDEAVAAGSDLVVAYHPPLFKPLTALHAAGAGTDALIWRAIRHGLAIYALHTALDAAPGGTNDVLADLCAATDRRPFEYVDSTPPECKVVVFVPEENVQAVADAMAACGAGRIGEYTRCSFRIPGTGTFEGSDATSPHVGQAGRFETVREIRLEMVVPESCLPAVAAALVEAHPYEEPAYDIYALRGRPGPGIGRWGRLPRPQRLSELARHFQQALGGAAPQLVGAPAAEVQRVAICAGAVGSLLDGLVLSPTDCLVTGELRHHDALSVLRRGTQALVLGHWASERPVLEHVARRLTERAPALEVRTSGADRDPFATV